MTKESKKKYYDNVVDAVKNKKQGDMVFFTSKNKWLIYTPENQMSKSCYVCKKIVDVGSGTYYRGKFVHKRCKGSLKIQWWKYQ